MEDSRMIAETAECALTGALLTLSTYPPDMVSRIVAMPSEWLWSQSRRISHATAGRLWAEGARVDALTLSLATKGVDGVSMTDAMTDGANSLPLYPDTIEATINAIRDAHIRRTLRSACQTAVGALDEGAATDTLLDGLTAAVGRLSAPDSVRPHSMADAVRKATQLAEDANERARAGTAVEYPSSIAELRQIDPYRPGRVIVIAGRPGMGKTAFAMQELLAFIRAGKSALVFSLEMQAAEIAVRVMAIQSGLRMGAFMRGDLASSGPYRDAIAAAIPLRMTIDDSTGGTIEHIQRVARMYQAQGLCDAVAIDHIGLVAPSDRGKGVMREQQVAHISNTIKRMAKQLGIPVLLLAQMNRQSEGRDSKRPMLSDLRESGAIEQDADIVIFPFRKGYHEPEKNDNSAELMILKNRHGMARNIACEWSPDRACYVDLGHRAGHAAPDPFDGRDLPEPP